MTDNPKTAPTTARIGGFLGGILGMFVWFNQPEGLLNVGAIAVTTLINGKVRVAKQVGRNHLAQLV